MNICFVCCRPFQVLNAINYIEMILKKKRRGKFAIDFFISNKYKGQFDLSSLGCIRKIYYFSENLNDGKLKKLGRYLFLKSSLAGCIENCRTDKLISYNEIYGTSYNNFFVRLCNINPRAKAVLLEDGIGTYMNDDYQKHLNSKFSRLLKRFDRGVLSVDVKELYCYHPELMCLPKEYPILDLPLLDQSSTSILDKVFHHANTSLYDEKKIIYFVSDVTWEKQYNIKESDFIDSIYEYKESLLIRFHPNRQGEVYKDLESDDTAQLWELRCKAVQSGNILVGIFSTAQFSPYLFYGKQYSVIFLYKMVFPKESYLYQQCEKTVAVLKKDFPKIYVPDTIEEYRNIVKELLR